MYWILYVNADVKFAILKKVIHKNYNSIFE